MIAWIFAIVIIAIVGKLMYDVQQKKNKPTQTEDAVTEALKFKEQWQTIAGIKPHNKEAAPFNPHNNKLNENIIDELKNDFQNSKFPLEDLSIPVSTTKITTIDTNFGSDNDPMASVPMSRVSKAAKQKMAEIAKEDITKQLEQNAERFIEQVESKLPDEMRKAMMEATMVKPKRKYNKKPKQ